MSDSLFTAAMNAANTAFSAVCSEEFAVLAGTTARPGTYTATSIDDLASAQAIAPGGLRGDNVVNVFVTKVVMAASGIIAGTLLRVRGKTVRVMSLSDDGDNLMLLPCASAGIKL